ncbi:ion transporter [Rhodobium gokarnense]|uniref:Voltage-gated sodium channel n=1 Tax=Rhodobium gokarnense TaxID=364296 RepID=A0ABT3H7R3_9HYPH|nr:ion transporter [Rhodobium gokarnense]MCW2306430.1 voltage-gated sodium channel [Rhodobium gokarnense]
MDKLRSIVTSPRFEGAIIVLIVINAITLGLETSQTVYGEIGPFLRVLDRIILAIFVIELVLRVIVHGRRFFVDPWSLFDTFVVAIALVPATGSLSVLRALRILRVLRLISVVPSLRRVVGGLVAALPGMGSIVLLMVLIFYVFSVMATKLYGAEFPEWFGTIGASAYSLFQIMTLESWSMGIVRPVMETNPYAWVFFVPFILSTAFTVLNLFIGIIVSAMQEEHEAEAAADRVAIHEETGNVVIELRALRKEVAELRDVIDNRRQTEERG